MSARVKKKITIYLEADLARALDTEAHVHGLPTTRAAADALRRVFLDESGTSVADTVKMRLDRVEKREVVRERETAIIKETLLLFIRVWLEHTPPPLEETLDATHAVAERRFQSFLELLAESLGPGQTLFAYAPNGRHSDPGGAQNPAASAIALHGAAE